MYHAHMITAAIRAPGPICPLDSLASTGCRADCDQLALSLLPVQWEPALMQSVAAVGEGVNAVAFISALLHFRFNSAL